MTLRVFSTILALALGSTLAGCSGDAPVGQDTGPEDTGGETDKPIVEDCDNKTDDDGDGDVDCDDSDCAPDAACAERSPEICTDGVDNDQDSAIDCNDADCDTHFTCIPEPDCNNDKDDDGDGRVDCLDDDCTGNISCIPEAVCADGVDDDSDSLTDCLDPDCADDPVCMPETACDDGLDDDSDGMLDCDDYDCVSDAACAGCADGNLGIAIDLPVATGNTIGNVDDFGTTCGGGSPAAEDVSWRWTAPEDGSYLFSITGSDYDTSMALWSDDCSEELECNDDYSGFQSGIVRDMLAGEAVVIVVDGYGDNAGHYALSVHHSAEGSCVDGEDADFDLFYDCDDTDCAADVACIYEMECDDAADDDLDGTTDCDDTDCADALSCTTPCADGDLGSAGGPAVATGSTWGAGDDYTSTCADYATEDIAWRWTAPADGEYVFDTRGSSYDTMLSVEYGDCSGTEIDCNDDAKLTTSSEVELTLAGGDEVVIHIEGYNDAGDYVLNISADTIEIACTDGLDDEGDSLIDCLDDECIGAPVCDVSLADEDLGSLTGDAVATGNTTGARDDWTPACETEDSTAGDYTYAWVAPSAGTWSFDTTGSDYDTILGVYAWDRSSLGCDDDGAADEHGSLVTLPLEAGQMVIVSVDGYASISGNYTLSIY